ncbi:MAG: hypothetical protein IT223_07775 [Crocinitomicaceae bacterium]|nr:hypothetical protein [Crocinitomicaceae bacterium]
MKYVSFVVVSAFTLFGSSVSHAQALQAEEKRTLFEKADSILNEFRETAGFHEAGLDEISDEMLFRHQALYSSGAMISDNICPERDSDGKIITTQKGSKKTIEQFLTDVKKEFPGGLFTRVLTANVSYAEIDKGIINLVLLRSQTGTTGDKWMIESTDSLQLILKKNTGGNQLLIAEAISLGQSIKCVNCEVVAVVTPPPPKPEKPAKPVDQPKPPKPEKPAKPEKPEKPEKPAKPVEPQKPPKPEKPIEQPKPPKPAKPAKPVEQPKPPKPEKPSEPLPWGLDWAIYGGFGLNSFKTDALTASELNSSLYDQLSAKDSKISGYRLNSFEKGFQAGTDFQIMYGKKKRAGLVLGMHFQKFNAEANVDQVIVSYRSEDKWNHSFNRIVNGTAVKDKISIATISLPVLVSLSTDIGENKFFYLQAGPVFGLSTTAAYKGSATVNFEAIYNVDENGNLSFNTNDENPENDLLMTAAAVAQRTGNTAAYFTNHHNAGYDIALGEEKSGEDKVDFKQKTSFLVAAGLGWNLSERISFVAGAQMSLANFFKDSSGYSAGDKTSDEYCSLTAPMKEAKITAYSIQLGLHIHLIKP